MSVGGYILMVAGMGLVTYLPRSIPLVYLAGRPLPERVMEWLDLIPAAILGALVAPMIIEAPGGGMDFLQDRFLVAVPTFLFALGTRSLGGTVILGMLLYWLAGKF